MRNYTFTIRFFTAFVLLFIATSAGAQSLNWATYFGGSADERSRSVAVDAAGNIYIAGNTSSASGIATSGAYQPALVGTLDAYLAKFTSTGSLVWATYFGSGIGTCKIAIDGSGNVYLAGTTSATSGITTTGAYQPAYAGGPDDAFLAKFSSSGSLLWATYYGGSGDDEYTMLTTDASGNVYAAGRTTSTSAIATSGAYQPAYGGGAWDAFLTKFSSSGTLLWATYYGGTDFDIATGVSADGSGNVYITGNTQSTSSIATTGAYQTVFGGVSDAFLAKFNGTGLLLWATYYGGSIDELGEGVVADGSGNAYICGYTFSPSGIATSGAYQTTNAGSYDGYLAKFSSSGSLLWGTYYGGSSGEYMSALAVTGSGSVWVVGYTYSTSGITTSGAYQTVLGGSRDAFLAKFNSAGSALMYGTYYGGSNDDVNQAITINGSNVYFTGFTSSTSAIATTGAYQTVEAGGYDAFLGVFYDGGPGAITGIPTLCVGSTTALSDTPGGGTWSSSAIGIATVGSSSGIVSGVAAGTAIITYTASTGIATIVVTVQTVPPTPTITSSITSVCTGHTITVNATPSGGTWTSLATSIGTVGSSSGIVSGIAAGTAPIVYTITNACGSSSATVNVTVTSGGPCTTKVKGKKESPPFVDAGLSIYPNPNNGSFTLTVGTGDAEPVQVVVTNILGQKVKELSVSSNEITELNLNQPPGIYFALARTAAQTWFTKVEIR